jgi:hypothetical protein
MGKRKSSPWLATTSAWMLPLLIMAGLLILYTCYYEIFSCFTIIKFMIR